MKKLLSFILSGIFVFGTFYTYAQTESEEEKPFTFGNISPIILSSGKLEIINTASLNSFWLTTNFGNQTIDRYRVSRFENNLNVQYGLSADKRWDIGLTGKYSRLLVDEQARNSPLKVFGSPGESSFGSSGLTMAGVRIRTQPFSNMNGLTLQGNLQFPILKDDQKKKELNAARLQTDVMATYFSTLSEDWYLFLQARYITQLANALVNSSTHFPGISAFVVRSLMDQKMFIYPGLSYLGSYEQYSRGGRLSSQGQYLMGGFGIQYQVLDNGGVFLYTQKPLYYHNGSTTYTQLIRSTYTDFALGLRLVL